MSIIGWIVFGLISGFVASKLVDNGGKGIVVDVLLGIIGAFVGGLLFNVIGEYGVTGFNLWSMFVAVIGAVVVLAGYHAITRNRLAT